VFLFHERLSRMKLEQFVATVVGVTLAGACTGFEL